jgi:plasmid stabilization system protein ParE
LPVLFHPAARAEADEAFEFYYSQSPESARAFVAELERGGRAIQDSPTTWAKYRLGTRRYMLSRFPYILVYCIHLERIEIVAVAHGHRRPGYWGDRLKLPID